MATNQTEPETSAGEEDNSFAIAIVLPAVFAIVLLMLLAIAFLLPRITRTANAADKEERKKKRMARLDDIVKTQHFVDWASKQRDADPTVAVTVNPTCVICLDEIADEAHIRPLGCRHVFHQACLDDWFSRWNEYCPLCHKPIIPGTREMRKKPLAPPAVAFIV